MTLTPDLTFVLAVLVFWTVLYALSRFFPLDKHGLEVKPAYFMYKSKSLNTFLDKMAKKQPFVWTVLSNVGVALAVGLMVFSVYLLVNNLLRLVFPIGGATPVFPAVIGITIRLYWLPYFFAAVAIVFLSHELAHGVVARLENIPVLSTGIVTALVFFGAFVEPDEKEFEKAPIKSRLRMLAVGSSTNLVTALLVSLLMGGLFAPPAGILIQETLPKGPVETAGLRQWDFIDAVNGVKISTILDFHDYMKNRSIGEELVLHTNQGYRNVTTIEGDEGQAIVGLTASIFPYRPNRLGLEHYTAVNLYVTLFWIYLLALSVAIFNMFPTYPFDGEKFLYYPLERFVKKRKREFRLALNMVFWGLILANMVLSFWKYGLIPI